MLVALAGRAATGGEVMPADERRWEMLERIGAYAAGELEGEEAREAERLIFERPDYRRLAESYARMLVMLEHAGKRARRGPRGRGRLRRQEGLRLGLHAQRGGLHRRPRPLLPRRVHPLSRPPGERRLTPSLSARSGFASACQPFSTSAFQPGSPWRRPCAGSRPFLTCGVRKTCVRGTYLKTRESRAGLPPSAPAAAREAEMLKC